MSNPDPKPPEPDPSETDAVSLEGGFDERKRQKVLALLANGSSRRMAARFVGVAASTITRAGVRDPEYGRQGDVPSDVGGPWDDEEEPTGSGGFSDQAASFSELPILPIPNDNATPLL